jgi:hypothetical protein
MDDPDAASGFIISPNPSSGLFTIEWMSGLPPGVVSIKVINTLGQILFSSAENINTIPWKKEIDLVNLARGVYFTELKTENDFFRKKIMIIRP